MKPWLIALTGLSIASCLIAAGAAGPAADDRRLKTAAANAALRKYDATVAKAKADYDKAVRPARELAVKELTDAMKAATRAGDLNEANEINAAIAALNAAAQGGADGGLVGTWDVLYSNGHRRTYKLFPDGTVEWVGTRRTAKAFQRGGDLLLEIESGKLERLSAWNGRLVLEHYYPATHYPNDPPDQIGFGTIKKTN
jgi:hypothetical protein